MAASQSEREEVPETMETLTWQLVRENERRSQRPWRPLPFQQIRANQRRFQ